MNARARLLVCTRHAALCVVVSVACLAFGETAHAFSDPAKFAETVDTGGGGGRYFTGSIADGYTCKVCHDQAEPTHMRIGGLPLAGYVPGTTYPISVEWPATIQHVALAAEVTDNNGAVLGELRVPDVAVLSDDELCAPAGFGIPATAVYDAAQGRKVAFVVDCGAKRARLEWHAPDRDLGPAWFVGSLVRTDNQGTNTGDSVTDFARTFGSPSKSTVDASDIAATCALAAVGGASHAASGSTAWCAIVVLAFMLRRRTRAVTCARPRQR